MKSTSCLNAGLKTVALLVMLAGLLLVACVREEVQAGSEVPTIDVAISDFTNTDIGWGVTALPSLISLPSSPSARRVIFNITNINAASTLADTPDIAHTLWVIKSDLPPDNLPTKGPGLGVDISKLDVWGAVPALNSGEKSALHLDLEPGKYVLICNIVPNNVEFPSHYEQGSFTGFTVKEER